MIKIEYVSLEQLRPNPDNPRTHSAEQIGKLARLITEFGFLAPILITADRMIIAGEGRWRAAKMAGIAQAPTIVAAHLGPEQIKAVMVADNKMSEMAGWDDEALRKIMTELESVGFDQELTGFSLDEIEAFNRQVAESLASAQSEAPPEIPITPELFEAHNYVVLYFDNELDWQAAMDTLGLRRVRTPNSRPGYMQIGIGRVIAGAPVIERLNR